MKLRRAFDSEKREKKFCCPFPQFSVTFEGRCTLVAAAAAAAAVEAALKTGIGRLSNFLLFGATSQDHHGTIKDHKFDARTLERQNNN